MCFYLSSQVVQTGHISLSSSTKDFNFLIASPLNHWWVQKCCSANGNELGASTSVSGGPWVSVWANKGVHNRDSLWRLSEHFQCPFATQCPSYNLTGPTYSALFKLVALYFFHPLFIETLPVIPYIVSTIARPVTSLSQCGHDVTVKKSCLASPYAFFFFFTCGFLKSLDAFMVRNKDKLGLCVIPGVLLSCHLATTRQLAARDVALQARSLFFFQPSSGAVTFCVEWRVLCRPAVCARVQGHITPLWQQDLHYKPSDAFLLTLHICLSSSLLRSLPLSLLLFLIFLSLTPLHFPKSPPQNRLAYWPAVFSVVGHKSV